MNGIDAVALATGQDWRAIEASCHTYASTQSDTGYKPLTHYYIDDSNTSSTSNTSYPHSNPDTTASHNTKTEKVLVGRLRVPLAIGVKGGVINTNPVYKTSLHLMGNPDTRTLSMLMTSVGLAQNFAALRALSTEGIQKGHMSLHARNIALAGIL